MVHVQLTIFVQCCCILYNHTLLKATKQDLHPPSILLFFAVPEGGFQRVNQDVTDLENHHLYYLVITRNLIFLIK